MLKTRPTTCCLGMMPRPYLAWNPPKTSDTEVRPFAKPVNARFTHYLLDSVQTAPNTPSLSPQLQTVSPLLTNRWHCHLSSSAAAVPRAGLELTCSFCSFCTIFSLPILVQLLSERGLYLSRYHLTISPSESVQVSFVPVRYV